MANFLSVHDIQPPALPATILSVTARMINEAKVHNAYLKYQELLREYKTTCECDGSLDDISKMISKQLRTLINGITVTALSAKTREQFTTWLLLANINPVHRLGLINTLNNKCMSAILYASSHGFDEQKHEVENMTYEDIEDIRNDLAEERHSSTQQYMQKKYALRQRERLRRERHKKIITMIRSRREVEAEHEGAINRSLDLWEQDDPNHSDRSPRLSDLGTYAPRNGKMLKCDQVEQDRDNAYKNNGMHY